MAGDEDTADGADWRMAHILWQRHGLRMEEYAEMPRNVQLAYIASEMLEQELPAGSMDRLAKAYLKSD